jgi:hypothetical protein
MPSAPAFPHLTDSQEPTNPNLWAKVIAVAKGDVREITVNGKTIHKPNPRFIWPSPPGSSWAVMQYNSLGGAWRPKTAFQANALRVLQANGLVEGRSFEEKSALAYLQEQGWAQKQAGSNFWEAGPRIVTAGLANELEQRMKKLLDNALDPRAYMEMAQWFDTNFRLNTAKTPKGQKSLKEDAARFLRVLSGRSLNDKLYPDILDRTEALQAAQESIIDIWRYVQPHIEDLVKYFSAEGDTAEGKKEVLFVLKLSNGTYFNRANISSVNFEKYAKSVDAVFGSLKGWRRKALAGELKVELVGSQEMQSQGRYRSEADTMQVKATPSVLKRGGGGYGSLEYILVHELGHRYDKLNRLPLDFDKPQWWTTRYSRTEGLSGGESFAELFALGHFKLTGNWDPTILDRFEEVMS